MKMTWELWGIIRHPPQQNPVYYRASHQAGITLSDSMRRVLTGIFGLGVVLLVFISLPVALILMTYGVVLLPAVLLLFNGMFYGLYRAVDISATLAQEYQRGTFDLLRVTPPGTAPIEWLISAGCLHRGELLLKINRIVRSFVNSVPLALLAIGVFVLLSFTAAQDAERWALSVHMLEIISAMLAFCAICYLDHVQSTITSCLAGILAAQTTRASIEARLSAALIFITLQIGAYVLIVFMSSMSVTLLRGIAGTTPLSVILSAALPVFMYYLVREAIIGGLWHLTLYQTNTTLTEWDQRGI